MSRKFHVRAFEHRLLLFFCSCVVLFAQADTFVMRTNVLAPYTRTNIGNGYFSISTSQWGSKPAESFMAGIYDHAEGDVPRLAAVPAWNEVNVFNGRAWLNDAPADAAHLSGYQQSVNMRDGYVRTQYRWNDGDRAASIGIQTFVSRLNPNLAAVKLEITPHYSGPVKVVLPLRAWTPPKRFALARLEKMDPKITQQQMWYPGHMAVQSHSVEAESKGGMLRMIAQPEGVKITVAEAAALVWPETLPGLAVNKSSSRDLAAVELSFQAAAEQPYTFYKFVAAVPSRDSADPATRAAQLAQAARSRGYDAVLEESAAEWHRLWQTDIVVDSTPEFQTLIHSMLFYLMCSVRENSAYSMPPMGLTTAGYYGHVFWDADTFMFPPLMILHPEMAKSIVMFRCNTLKAAQANAHRNGWKGAMFPWEAGPEGAETTPKFAYQNATSEIHVSGDVALAQWQYYLATGDRTWLARYGYPVISETANFWVSRVTYNRERDRYEIRNVVSINESLIGVDDDPYTNAVAAKNLELAISAAKIVGAAPNPDWAKIVHKLYVPSTPYLLYSYPLERPSTEQQKRKVLETALQRYAPRQAGVMMEITFYPILAVEAHSPELLEKFASLDLSALPGAAVQCAARSTEQLEYQLPHRCRRLSSAVRVRLSRAALQRGRTYAEISASSASHDQGTHGEERRRSRPCPGH
ncbi:MAG TPA: hypothetical protein VN428_11095 [Bryobacteraceae bacterium]|nr:hypothetical protein [Bryobacteraceae bacterium]